MILKPRQYQIDSIDAVTAAWEGGLLRPAVVLPTGAGKLDGYILTPHQEVPRTQRVSCRGPGPLRQGAQRGWEFGVRIFVHKETRTVSRDSMTWGRDFEEVEVDRDHREELLLSFERFEVHRSSSTAWFRVIDDTAGTWKPTRRKLPMRISEFERVLKKGGDMLMLRGTFGFSKQGTAVGLVLHDV